MEEIIESGGGRSDEQLKEKQQQLKSNWAPVLNEGEPTVSGPEPRFSLSELPVSGGGASR